MTALVSLLCAVLLMLSCCRANENSTVDGTAMESGNKHTLYFLSMLPYPDPRPSFQALFQDGPDILPAAYLAIDEINNRTDILNDYQIELIEADGGCDVETKPLETFVANVFHSGKQVVGIIGPGCSDSAVAVSALCGRSEIALVTVHIANSPLLANRTLFPYAFATADTSLVVVESIIELMRYNDWRRVSLIYDVSTLEFIPLAESLIEKTSRLQGYSIAISVPFLKVNDIPVTDIENSFVRIIILMANSNDSICEMLCLAHQRQLVYPAYQWVITGADNLSCHTEVNATAERIQYSCTAEELMATLRGMTVITDTFPTADNNTLPKSNLTREEFKVAIREYGSNATSIDPSDVFYDGVWSLALALNNSVELLRQQNLSFSDYHYGMEDITQVIQQQFYRLDFNGVSGHVKYEPNSGARNYTATLQQYTSSLAYGGSFQRGEWDILDNATFIPGEFPSDFPHLSHIAAAFVLVFASTTAIVVASLHILTIVYRDESYVKASCPTLSHFVYIGCYVILFAVVIYTLTQAFEFKYRTYNALCNTTVWSVSLGLTLMLGTVCLKTWRLYDIFEISSRHFSTSAKLSNRVLVIGVFILILIDITICVIWSSVDPPVQHKTQSFETIHGDRFVAMKYTCQSKGHLEAIMAPLLVLYKLLLLACSAYLAFLTRRIRMELFKTRNVTRLAYLFCLVGALGLPAFFVTQHLGKDTAAYAILCTLLSLLVILCVLFLFLPPLLPKLKTKVSSCLPALNKQQQGFIGYTVTER